MHIEAEIAYSMSPVELDRWLSAGWFRSGALLFRAPLLILDSEVRDLVQVRLRLDANTPRSRRRLLRRNRGRFRCEFGPAVVDDAAQRLYEETRARFIDFIANDLSELVIGELPGVFDTRELRVFDGDRVVALSYFDVGREAVTGILGLHDPAFAKHGLGIYTMLEEVEFARSHAARWYYPGYVVPGLPSFDYKLSLGAVEYLNGEGAWLERGRAPEATSRAVHATQRMEQLGAALLAAGHDAIPRRYPAFWAGRLADADRDYLQAMWHVSCGPPEQDPVVVEYLSDHDRFVVCRVDHAANLDPFEGFVADPALEAACEQRLLMYRERLLETDSLQEAVEAVGR
jgi:leucyl-tRNA---protein transferase